MTAPEKLRKRFARVAVVYARMRNALDHLIYERWLGLDTGGVISLSEHNAQKLPYQGAGWRLLRQRLHKDELRPDDVFLDAGCGKGRVVLQAARLYPFKRVMGFDFSPDLVAIAQANIDKRRRRLRCNDVEIFVADAESWQVPDDVTIVFLYNPFIGDVLRRFVDSVLESYDRRPRRLRLLYVEGWGWEYPVVERTGRFSLVSVHEDECGGQDSRLYEVTPSRVCRGLGYTKSGSDER